MLIRKYFLIPRILYFATWDKVDVKLCNVMFNTNLYTVMK